MENNLYKYGTVNTCLKTFNIFVHVKPELDIDLVFNEIISIIDSKYDIKITNVEERIITLFKLAKLSDMPEYFKELISKGLNDGSFTFS